MIVLGYNGFSNSAAFFDAYFGSRGKDRHLLMGHDAAAALFKEGILVAAAEEERFSRIKKTSDFPGHAIRYCLQEAGIAVTDIDYVTMPWDCNEKWLNDLLIAILQKEGTLLEKLELLGKMKSFYFQVASHEKVIEDFNSNMGTDFGPEKFIFVPHHLAHVMCGFFLSEMKESAFLVTDGRGEAYSSIMGKIDRNHFEIFDWVSISNSIGILYRKFTRYLGFTPNSDEYKVMALSAFVQSPPQYDVNQFIEFLPNGRFKIVLPGGDDHLSYYRFFEKFFGEKTEKTFNNMAYFIQQLTEMVIWHQVSFLQDKVDNDTLFIEGGVALNCVNNSKVLAKSRFKDVHVGFAANDTGVAIGAAFFPFYDQKQFQNNTITPYLGPAFSNSDILTALQAKSDQIIFRELEESQLLEEVVEQLAHKKIIGWFQGKMEYGPRALGNRSILASPVFPDMKDIINAKVKYREPFRPFAGVTIESEADQYFEMGKKKTSPFMTFVFDAKPSVKDKVISALHVDGTSRLQTISEQQNPRLYRLLLAFSKKTGITCLINTSFNVQGEPIVCSPTDAVNCFLNSGIDVLVLDRFVVYKKKTDA